MGIPCTLLVAYTSVLGGTVDWIASPCDDDCTGTGVGPANEEEKTKYETKPNQTILYCQNITMYSNRHISPKTITITPHQTRIQTYRISCHVLTVNAPTSSAGRQSSDYAIT